MKLTYLLQHCMIQHHAEAVGGCDLPELGLELGLEEGVVVAAKEVEVTGAVAEEVEREGMLGLMAGGCNHGLEDLMKLST